MCEEQQKQLPLATYNHLFLCFGHVNLTVYSRIRSSNSYLLNSYYASAADLGTMGIRWMIVDRGITCLDELPRSLCFSVCGMEWLKGWQDEALENKKACLALVLMESEEA